MGPLTGLVVLDLGQYLAGPFGPMVLADLGAEVIKVEPVRGDGMRMAGMPFVGCQRGKLDIAVDIKAPEGLEAVLRLAEVADVVHHNMTKGTAARLGIDYESLKERNPDLVHCNTYAYGAEGPLSEFGGLDPLYQAACGLEFEAGPVAEGNPPLYLRFGMTDTANALVSVVGVLAALYHRRRTGEGQDLWTSLLNGAAVFGSDVFLVDDQPGPVRPGLDGNQMGVSPCCRLYVTQEGWIQVAAFASGQWAQLCRLVGRPEFERHETFEARVAARAEIESALEPIFLARTAVAWYHHLVEVGVDAEVSIDSNDGEVVLHDADNERLGLVAEYPHPILGQLRQFGTLIEILGVCDRPLRPSAFGGRAHPGHHGAPRLLERRDRRPDEPGNRLRTDRGLSLDALNSVASREPRPSSPWSRSVPESRKEDRKTRPGGDKAERLRVGKRAGPQGAAMTTEPVTEMTGLDTIAELAAQLRVDSIRSSTSAGSGHPTSSMSAADLIAVLAARHLHYDWDDPHAPANDHLVFSKGHASPLLYSLFKAAAVVSDEELMTGYRRFGQRLEGHPTPVLPWVDVATGSLGQGLPDGVGIALSGRYLEHLPFRVWVLCGDSELAEGSIWEAIDKASYYKLSNLVVMADINRLGSAGRPISVGTSTTTSGVSKPSAPARS